MLTAEISSVNYYVELDENAFARLLSLDFLTEIYPKLEEAGADLINYDGHFGKNIYFRAHPSELDEILYILSNILQG